MAPLILIPAYNEAASLPAVVREIREHVAGCEILIVDDDSTDDTARLLPALGVRWIRLPVRLGTGAVVRTGLRWATAHGYDLVVRVDGDGQHPAEAIALLVARVGDGSADAAIGSRYADGRPVATPPVRRWMHRMLARILTVLTRQRVTDPTSGLWAFGPRAVALLSEHHPSGYPEPELLLLLARNGIRVAEVPVSMRSRFAGRTSLTPQRTGAALARLLLLLLVVPLRATVGDRHD